LPPPVWAAVRVSAPLLLYRFNLLPPEESDPAAINIFTHRRQVAADSTTSHHTQPKGEHMRLIAFPQWDKVTSLLRGMARQSAADYAQRKIVRIIPKNGVVHMC